MNTKSHRDLLLTYAKQHIATNTIQLANYCISEKDAGAKITVHLTDLAICRRYQ